MNAYILNIWIISKDCACFQYVQSISVDFCKESELNVWKLVSITLNYVRIKSVVHKIVQTFSQRVKPQTIKFLVLDEHSHIEYMDYLKKLCMFPVRLVNNCRFL